jgi:hypothetical protein
MSSTHETAVQRDAWAAFLSVGLLGASPLIRNAQVSVSSVEANGERVPLVTNETGSAGCSWVTSLRNAYGPYARAETDIVGMNRLVWPFYVAASHAAEALMAAGGLSGGNYLNNWLLATNLYRPELTATDIFALRDEVCRRNPRLPMVVRSLTPPLHAPMLAELAAAGFLLFPSRQVWLVHEPASGAWRRHRDSRRDVALSRSTSGQWTWVPSADFMDRDFTRACELYQRLYRQRYPHFNPDYTETFFRVGVATGFLDLVGLRATGSADLSGVVGMVHRGAVSCTPVLGYDIDAPAALGLYRLLMLHAFQECERRRTMFHCSAGAGLFKFNRGAEAHVEFAAVWANHLPLYRRANLRVLAATVRTCVLPYLQSHQV